MKHPTEEQLVAFRLGDASAGEAAEIEEHLHVCEACGWVLDTVDLVLGAAARMPVPERPEGYGAHVWARVQPRLHEAAPTRWQAFREWFTPRQLAWAGGFAVLFLAAFVAGRFWPRPVPAAVATNQQQQAAAAPATRSAEAAQPATAAAAASQGAGDDQVREQILLAAMGDHLERSQVALVELVNGSQGARAVDISPVQDWARDLVAENRIYRQTAAETGNAALASVLDELERVLVEVANSPAQMPKTDFERVRTRIESQGILFKVRVLGQHVRDLEAPPAADGRVQG